MNVNKINNDTCRKSSFNSSSFGNFQPNKSNTIVTENIEAKNTIKKEKGLEICCQISIRFR